MAERPAYIPYAQPPGVAGYLPYGWAAAIRDRLSARGAEPLPPPAEEPVARPPLRSAGDLRVPSVPRGMPLQAPEGPSPLRRFYEGLGTGQAPVMDEDQMPRAGRYPAQPLPSPHDAENAAVTAALSASPRLAMAAEGDYPALPAPQMRGRPEIDYPALQPTAAPLPAPSGGAALPMPPPMRPDPMQVIAEGAAPPEINGRRLAVPGEPTVAADAGGEPLPGGANVAQVAAQPLPAPTGTPGGTPAGRRQAVLNALPQAPDAEMPDDSVGRMLMRFGLGMAEAGGRPGATTLSAVGAGGREVMNAQDHAMARRAQMKQQAFSNQMARETAAATIAGADTKERQGDRQLDLEEKKILETAQTRLAEIKQRSEDKALDREVQRQLGQERIELQRLIAAGQQGNQRALIDLKETMQRNADDRDAGELLEKTLGRYRDAAGQISPENETKAHSMVAKAHPNSRAGQSFIRGVTTDAKSAIAEIEQSQLEDTEKKKRIEAIRKRTLSLTGQGLD